MPENAHSYDVTPDPPIENPYVGPRAFKPAERDLFFGRDQEARELTATIVVHKVVLFYAPAGAGKSSLLNTRMRDLLQQDGFEVLPAARVGGHDHSTDADNIFVYNLLLSLEQQPSVKAELASLSLADYLDQLVQHDDGAYYYDPEYVYPEDATLRPRVLIIDQFEEFLTTETTRRQRHVFFEQLSEALTLDDQLWVVLAMREDFVSRLNPFLHIAPEGLRHRYAMQALRRPAALDAIRLPAAKVGRPFDADAAEWLVDDLRRGEEGKQLSRFVEPVQLQAVCYTMWQTLKQTPGAMITLADVQGTADVEAPLGNFYDTAIANTVASFAISETELRNWIEREFVTEDGTRKLVFRGRKTTGGMPTELADRVHEQFILQAVKRPDGTWYQLAHDEFVPLIERDNEVWRRQPLLLLAELWKEGEAKLLTPEQLEGADDDLLQRLGPDVVAFAEASHQADAVRQEKARERERQQQQKLAEVERQLAEQTEQVRKTEQQQQQKLAEVERQLAQQTEQVKTWKRQPLLLLAESWKEGNGMLLSAEQLESLTPAQLQQLDPAVSEYVAASRQEVQATQRKHAATQPTPAAVTTAAEPPPPAPDRSASRPPPPVAIEQSAPPERKRRRRRPGCVTISIVLLVLLAIAAALIYADRSFATFGGAVQQSAVELSDRARSAISGIGIELPFGDLTEEPSPTEAPSQEGVRLSVGELLARGRALAGSGEIQEAVETVQDALQLDPDAGGAMFNELDDGNQQAITDEQFLWQFEGAAGEQVTIAMFALSDELDPLLTLLGPNGEQIASNDNYDGSFDSQISVTLPEDGRYVVVAGANSGSGEYILRLERGAE